MKKMILISLIIFPFCVKSYGQVQYELPEPSVFSIGPKASFAHSFIMPDKNWEFFPGGAAGISTVYSPRQTWGLGLDAMYSFEGGKTKQEMNGEFELERKLEYIRVPLRAIVFFGKYEDNFRPKISLGPSFGFLLNDENELYPKIAAEPFDLGAELAIGFNQRLWEAVWLNIDLAYYQGFLDVYKDQKEMQYNGNLSISAGILFGLGN